MTFAFCPCFTTCLAAVLLSIAVADSDALPRSQASAMNNAGTNCAWDCKVVDSTFGLEMKALISEFRLISLQLKYDQQVDENCLNQTDIQNSSIKLADLWTCLTGDNLSHGGQNMSQHSFIKSNYWFRKLPEGQIEVRVSCFLKRAVDLNNTEASLNDVIAMVLIEEVAKFADLSHFETAFCYKLSAENGSYVCVNITLTCHNNLVTWKKQVFYGLALVVVFILLFYFPLLCFLFTPTKYRDEATDEVMIVLHGTSPESIRSWIADKFSLYDVREDFVKHKYKRLLNAFLLFVISLGLTKLASEIRSLLFPPTNWNIEILALLLAYFLPVSFVPLFMIRAIIRFRCQTLSPEQPCIICSVFGDKQNIAHDLKNPEYYGRKEMEMHLLWLSSIIKRCHTQTYLRCTAVLDHCGPSSLVKKLFSFLLFPVWITIYLVYVVAVLLYSSPSSTFYDMFMYQNPQNLYDKRLLFSVFFETSFLLNGAFILVVATAMNLLIIFRGCLLGLPNYLPYASLLTVTVCYVWEVYITYLRTYNNLAFKLLEHYKKKQGDPEDCSRMIPKDLYDKGCEKLMPLKKSRGKLIAASFAILIGIFTVFVTITEAPRLDDQTKAFGLTLLAILLPKFVGMFLGKHPLVKKADDEDFDEKVASFVKEYFSNYAGQNGNSIIDKNSSTTGNNSSTDPSRLLNIE